MQVVGQNVSGFGVNRLGFGVLGSRRISLHASLEIHRAETALADALAPINLRQATKRFAVPINVDFSGRPTIQRLDASIRATSVGRT